MVDLPRKNGEFLHRFLYVYQRVAPQLPSQFNSLGLGPFKFQG